MALDFVKPYNDDPQLGHLSTPISDSPLVRAYIGNLPAYRPGLSPLLRGLEIGMAHGYFLVGPEVVVGPLRDYAPAANLGGLVTAIVLVLLGTACLAAYGIVTFQNGRRDEKAVLKSSEDWTQFAGGFFLGGSGSAFVAYFLLENFAGVDAILRGLVN
ncbi:MAG: photosystem I reaction center protein subunit XI [Pseudanabaenaceae cyanobacterium SKYGB_i_bin29]|nr:photosystem I reaction center protein subunit XI [Pseudanabaenaceae cyanobacterium SKYG29]MDW8421976.1 photosystem I reaction center protein subunit XI [Pseudanabaenaceae cyanobacterium SKYGB_i_bin29]